MLTARVDGIFSPRGVEAGWFVCGGCCGRGCGGGGGFGSCGDCCLAGDEADGFSETETFSFDFLLSCSAGDVHINEGCSFSIVSSFFSCLRLQLTRKSSGSSPSDLSALFADRGLGSSLSPSFSRSWEGERASVAVDKSLGKHSCSLFSSSDIWLSLPAGRKSLGLGYVGPPLALNGGRAGDGRSCDTASSAEGGETLLDPAASWGGVTDGPFLKLSLLFLSEYDRCSRSWALWCWRRNCWRWWHSAFSAVLCVDIWSSSRSLVWWLAGNSKGLLRNEWDVWGEVWWKIEG